MFATLTRKQVLLVTLLIMLFLLARNLIAQGDDLLAANLPNPDSYQKLVMVRDHDPSQGFNFMVRENAPNGFWMHWSLPHTGLIWAGHHALMGMSLDQDTALLVAGGALTMLSLLLLIAFLALALLNHANPQAALLGIIAIASSPPIHGYGQLLQITHHIFMLVPVAAAAACFLRSNFQRMPWADFSGGLLLGLALWISPETMPLVLTLAAMRAAIRVQHPAAGPVWPVAAGLMVMLVTAWAVDPPPPTFTAWALDHMSYTWLMLGGLIAGLLIHTDLCSMRRLKTYRASIELAMSLSLAAVAWLLTVPDIAQGPDGLITPYLHDVWYRHISELQPATNLSKAVGYLLLPFAGGTLLLWAAWRHKSLWMTVLALSTLAYAILISGHVRMGAAGAFLGALSFAIALNQLFPLKRLSDPALPSPTQGIVALLILLLPAQLVVHVLADSVENTGNSPSTSKSDTACLFEDIEPLLKQLPPGVLLTNSNLGQEVLFKTAHRIIAGNYHHNLDGLTDSFRMLRDMPPDDLAKQIAKARGVDYLLVCRESQPGLTQPNSLAERASRGEPIYWLPRQQRIKGWVLYSRS